MLNRYKLQDHVSHSTYSTELRYSRLTFKRSSKRLQRIRNNITAKGNHRRRSENRIGNKILYINVMSAIKLVGYKV